MYRDPESPFYQLNSKQRRSNTDIEGIMNDFSKTPLNLFVKGAATRKSHKIQKNKKHEIDLIIVEKVDEPEQEIHQVIQIEELDKDDSKVETTEDK